MPAPDIFNYLQQQNAAMAQGPQGNLDWLAPAVGGMFDDIDKRKAAASAAKIAADERARKQQAEQFDQDMKLMPIMQQRGQDLMAQGNYKGAADLNNSTGYQGMMSRNGLPAPVLQGGKVQQFSAPEQAGAFAGPLGFLSPEMSGAAAEFYGTAPVTSTNWSDPQTQAALTGTFGPPKLTPHNIGEGGTMALLDRSGNVVNTVNGPAKTYAPRTPGVTWSAPTDNGDGTQTKRASNGDTQIIGSRNPKPPTYKQFVEDHTDETMPKIMSPQEIEEKVKAEMTTFGSGAIKPPAAEMYRHANQTRTKFQQINEGEKARAVRLHQAHKQFLSGGDQGSGGTQPASTNGAQPAHAEFMGWFDKVMKRAEGIAGKTNAR